MNVVGLAKDVLEENGYRTWQRVDETDQLYFEDVSILGMISEYHSIKDLLKTWEDRQDKFLRSHAKQLRAPGGKDKVWNAYTVHLTVERIGGERKEAVARLENSLFRIEEDFRGTRKIARCGLESREDVVNALLPLLGIEHWVELGAERYREELKKRIERKFDKAFLDVLDGDVCVKEIADNLLEE